MPNADPTPAALAAQPQEPEPSRDAMTRGAYISPATHCPRCVSRGHPEVCGSPIECGFTSDGSFRSQNWNCATLGELRQLAWRNNRATRWDDVSICHVPLPEYGGFVVLSWYKNRGRTDGAFVICEDECRPMTLADATTAIATGFLGYTEATP
jgi:hypothetical protein